MVAIPRKFFLIWHYPSNGWKQSNNDVKKKKKNSKIFLHHNILKLLTKYSNTYSIYFHSLLHIYRDLAESYRTSTLYSLYTKSVSHLFPFEFFFYLVRRWNERVSSLEMFKPSKFDVGIDTICHTISIRIHGHDSSKKVTRNGFRRKKK